VAEGRHRIAVAHVPQEIEQQRRRTGIEHGEAAAGLIFPQSEAFSAPPLAAYPAM
jgi:hypothetical protein